ncbi:MAG TPA: MFS transporter [Candidatus Acidoferrum sp.]|nr:MFS transporter [Candidatus Acidoferrum sp.]
MAKEDVAKLALRFVLLFGVVNFFADMTYEGARSINGPFLASLGASAAIVGFVAGFGEFVGYALRSVSGYFADKTHRYWAVTFVGYFINMMAVPALALAGNWPVAAALMVAERTGRAIRRPAVEAMISHAGKSIGRGWVFGLNEAMDQAGATIGPLIAAFVLYRRGGYSHSYAVLLISACLCLGTVCVAWIFNRHPEKLESESPQLALRKGLTKSYWLYVAAGALIAVGFADFSLIAFHFQKVNVVSQALVPVYYAVAMASGALAALISGKLLDKIGISAVVIAVGLATLFAPMVFLGGEKLALAGMVLWGIGIGTQDSSLKAILSGVVASEKRSTGFGIFDTSFGVAWFAGSAIMGLLYGVSIPALIIFSMIFQLLALPVFAFAKNQEPAK